MNAKIVIKVMLTLLSLVIAFRLCILVKVIPYELTWGGRLKNDQEMYVFEAISILINLILIFVLLLKGQFLKFQIKEKALNIILWVFFYIFILNTIGNLFAKSTFEKSLSLLTLVSAILIWNILRIKKIN